MHPDFSSMKQLEVFVLPLDGMLVHHKVIPRIKFTGTHLYTWVDRGTAREESLEQEHNAMCLARAQIQIVQSKDKHTNLEEPIPP